MPVGAHCDFVVKGATLRHSMNLSSPPSLPTVAPQNSLSQNSDPENTIDKRAPRPYFLRASSWFLVLMAFYALMLLSDLGRFHFVGPDEPRYAEIAREMFASGDYISPRLCYLLWFEKPILFYWLASSSYHLFGVSEFAARLPSALLALASSAFVWHSLRRLGFVRWAMASAVVLSTSAIWLYFSFASTIDMTLSSTLCIALLAAYMSTTQSGRSRLGYLMLCAVFSAASVLAKGLVGIFFVVVIVTIFRFVMKRAFFRSWKEALAVLLVFSVVVASWYAPVLLRHGSVFFDEFFVNQQFRRYTSDKYRHDQPVYFYLFVVFVGALPWSGFLLPAIARWRTMQPRTEPRDALRAFAWIWFLVPLVFFSFSGAKLPGYILPIFPALALLCGIEIERWWNGERPANVRIAAIFNAALLVLIGVAGFALGYKKPFFSALTIALFSALIILGIVALWGALRQRRATILAPALATLGVMGTAFFLLPTLSEGASRGEYSIRVASHLRPGETLAFYVLSRQYAHVFYSKGRVVYYQDGLPIRNISSGDDLDIDNRAELLTALRDLKRRGQSSLIVLTKAALSPEMTNDALISAQRLEHYKDLVAFRVSLKSGNR